jgi:hypothetical protein
MFLAFVLVFPRAELWVADEEDAEDAMPAGPSIIDEEVPNLQHTRHDGRADPARLRI